MIIALDIDGVLCEEIEAIKFKEELSSKLFTMVKAIDGAAEKVKEFVDRGDFILYYTSRPEVDRIVTSIWLEKNGFPNAPLFMGKPQADVYVDDNAVRSLDELF